MHPFLRTAAAIAVIACAAAPAYAQVNTSQVGASGSVSLNAGFVPDPFGVTVVAGGSISASSLGGDCRGNIAGRASFTLNYQAGDSYPLIVSATSNGDTVLAVLSPSGEWSCNDDSDRLNPAVRFDAPRSGRYQIWVGTFGTETEQAMLHISEVRSGGGQFSGEAPDFNLDPTYGFASLVSGFEPDPHEQELAAGGDYDAAQLQQQGCVGWIARAPDYRVYFTPGELGLPLIFSVNSNADTTLVISDPSGTWVCDDDGGEFGLNPAVRVDTPLAGQYDVWVGTYSQGTLQPSTLHVSELTTW